MDATTLELDAVKFAKLAVQQDQSGRYQEAVFYYKVRRGRAGSLGAPLSPSPRRGLHDGLELREGSRSPVGPAEGRRGVLGPPRPGTALQAERDAPGQCGRPRPARRVCPGSELLGPGKTRRCPPRRERRTGVSVESLSVFGGAAFFRASCETPFPCVPVLGGNECCPCADVYRQA